jgi:hypothetical protein
VGSIPIARSNTFNGLAGQGIDPQSALSAYCQRNLFESRSPGDKPLPKKQTTAPAWDRGGGGCQKQLRCEGPCYHRALDAARLGKLIDASNRAKRRDREARQRQPADRRMAHFRLPELERIYADRYGPVLPDDDAGRSDLFIAFNHIANMTGDVMARMVAWARMWAPWMGEAEVQWRAARAAQQPLRWKADTLGKLLRLTDADRQRLRIKTIGACDVSKAERVRRVNERRNAKRQKQTREGYLAANTASRAEPWKAEGISRAKWYRRGRHLETSPRQHTSIPMLAPTCLTPHPMASAEHARQGCIGGLDQNTTGTVRPPG